MKTITRENLEEIFKRLIKKLTDENVREIIIEDDLYRFIPTDDWDRYDEDIILEGSLYDDIDSLNILIKDNERYCTYVDFDRTASILRAISEKLAPVDN